MNKYGARKTVIDGLTFDSKAEARRWQELQMLAMAGAIHSLARQTVFNLTVNGVKVCKYVADFCYWENDVYVVEDVKGVKTAAYVIKRKLMLACHDIAIREITA